MLEEQASDGRSHGGRRCDCVIGLVEWAGDDLEQFRDQGQCRSTMSRDE